jgi:hypothetical protein
MQQEFEHLMRGVCALTGLPSAQRLIDGDGFACAQVNFAITRKPHAHPDALFVHADFGPLSDAQQAIFYPLLLKENLMMMSTRQATFSVSAVRDSVVLIETMRLPGLTPAALVSAIQKLARSSHYFSKHHRGGSSASARYVPRRGDTTSFFINRSQASC